MIPVHLDNIISKHDDETNAAEDRALLPRQASVGAVPSPTSAQLDQNPHNLEVNSAVQYGKPVEYGVIKWMGILPGKENIHFAGVEMVRYSIKTLLVYPSCKWNFSFVF